MGGTNPFIEPLQTAGPTQRYRVTFQPLDATVDVDPEALPYGRDGQPGSLLDIALAHDIDIDHVCGGVCACSTCHVIVRAGIESCNESTDDEEDQLDNAPGLEPGSRLACQCIPNGTVDVVVEIPNWNRNQVSETPH